ncbi:hypothetical protein LCGC14_2543550 [marine sediment metagenome]|uniref:Uncharacterized protein n=1 Tax=marine sediment metagenome TaxID=412755 RepID=A0A0F9AQD9_9ZZZZ
MIWSFRWWLHKTTGYRDYFSPSDFIALRYWLFWAWNEYDDWLYDGIHGFRICGHEFDTFPRWLNWASWKLLPVFRLFIRRPPRA